jgi:GntR family transcriptional repressor for pyruvate dehydrogenase complex
MKEPMFDPMAAVAVRNKVDVVMERITRAVQDSVYGPGDRLPSEREVAERMGVSRAVVREAFCALHVAGLLERREGSGSFIVDSPHPEVVRERARTILREKADPLDAWKIRAVIEPALAELIVANAEDADVMSMAAALESIKKAAAVGDWHEYLNADKSFHIALVSAAGSPCLLDLMAPLVDAMLGQVARRIKESYFLESKQNVASSEEAHSRILEAVRGRDVKATRGALEAHFQRLHEVIEGCPEDDATSRTGRRTSQRAGGV